MVTAAVKEQLKNNRKLEIFLKGLEESDLTIAMMVLSTKYLYGKSCRYEREGDNKLAEACKTMADQSRKITKMVIHMGGISRDRFRYIEKGIYDRETIL